ncbi:hypothetical protein [Flavobacterium sp.]|uniref:hypothetical protein n=1 Tax=Flavobacterium sp. TaxID=239 RepID=UPI003752E940
MDSSSDSINSELVTLNEEETAKLFSSNVETTFKGRTMTGSEFKKALDSVNNHVFLKTANPDAKVTDPDGFTRSFFFPTAKTEDFYAYPYLQWNNGDGNFTRMASSSSQAVENTWLPGAVYGTAGSNRRPQTIIHWRAGYQTAQGSGTAQQLLYDSHRAGLRPLFWEHEIFESTVVDINGTSQAGQSIAQITPVSGQLGITNYLGVDKNIKELINGFNETLYSGDQVVTTFKQRDVAYQFGTGITLATEISSNESISGAAPGSVVQGNVTTGQSGSVAVGFNYSSDVTNTDNTGYSTSANQVLGFPIIIIKKDNTCRFQVFKVLVSSKYNIKIRSKLKGDIAVRRRVSTNSDINEYRLNAANSLLPASIRDGLETSHVYETTYASFYKTFQCKNTVTGVKGPIYGPISPGFTFTFL